MCYSTATLVSVYMIILINGSSFICTPSFNGQPVMGVHISYIGPFLYDVFKGVSLIYRIYEIYY